MGTEKREERQKSNFSSDNVKGEYCLSINLTESVMCYHAVDIILK